MKRRTLLSTGVALLATVRTAFGSNATTTQPQNKEEPLSLYDAVKAVYDGFEPLKGSEEFVFMVPTIHPQNYARFLCKKIIALTGKHKGELWVVLEERFSGPTYIGDMVKPGSTREIKIVRLLPGQDDVSDESLKTRFEWSGKRLIYRISQDHKGFEMNKLSRVSWENNSMNWHEQEIEFQIFSRFFRLV